MKILITYLFCFSTLISFAQHTVNGIVTDSNGQPIVGANVYLEGTYDGATTDETGMFSFSTEETGNQKLVISYLSYETKQIEGDVTTLNALQIKLRDDVESLDTVVISAGTF